MVGGSGETPLVITFGPGASRGIVQAVTRNITFRVVGDAPTPEDRQIEFVLQDPDEKFSTTKRVTASVTAINDPPQFSLGGTTSYTENTALRLLGQSVTLTDVDSLDFAGGQITAQVTKNGTIDDRIEIRNQGVGPGQIGVSGNSVTYGGTTIGTFTGGTGTTALVISLNASATPTAAQALTRMIGFRVLGDNPSTLTRTITVSVSDGDGGTVTKTKLVTIVAKPDAPRLFGTGTIAYTHGDPAILLAATAAVSDPDTPAFNGGELNIRTVAGPSASNQLTTSSVSGNVVTVGGTVIGTLISDGANGNDFTVRFNSSATVALVQQLIRSIKFSRATGTGQVQYGITVSDGTGMTSTEIVRTINIS
jgi:hypothetical protein